MEKLMKTSKLANVTEVAKYLNLCRSSVYNLMDTGQLPYAKFGRSRRIPWDAVEEFVESSMKGGWALGEKAESNDQAATL